MARAVEATVGAQIPIPPWGTIKTRNAFGTEEQSAPRWPDATWYRLRGVVMTPAAPKPAPQPKAPKTLGVAGKALWDSIHADLPPGWELDGRELHFLERAAQCSDDLALLDAAIKKTGAMAEGSRGQSTVNPAISEARQLRLAQRQLLSAIEMGDPASSARNSTPAQVRARKAADARWGNRKGRAA